MDEDEVEMMEETEAPHTPGAPEQADDGDGEKDTDIEDERFRCKHYKRKCQFVVSLNWFVYKRGPKTLF